MKKLIIIAFNIILLFSAGIAGAGPDLYSGDITIYGGSAATTQPNVLIILDTSYSMNDESLPSNPYAGQSTVYPGTYLTDHVYKCTAWGNECGNWVDTVANVNNVVTSCGNSDPRNILTTIGMWNSSANKLSNAGACEKGSGIYATGNYINWRTPATGTTEKKIDIAKRVLTNLVKSTQGVKIGLMIFNGNQGAKIHSATVLSKSYVALVKNMDNPFSTTGITNREALVSSVSAITPDSWTPLAESLYEAMMYYKGSPSAFTNASYTSPIVAGCQANFVILLTDGMSTEDRDNVLLKLCNNGDCNGDGHEPDGDPEKTYPNLGSDYLDDVAWYLHNTDMITKYPGSKVTSYMVGFGLGGSNLGAIKLLKEAAALGADPVGVDAAGKPIPQNAFLPNDETALTLALQAILGKVMEVNTSFVAPAVPVSPENKLYAGNRIYMGFFKPQSGKQWFGNLKKYTLDLKTNTILDKNGNAATDPVSGSFLPYTQSFWNSVTNEGGEVNKGGVGELLNKRDLRPGQNPRKIYTYLGASKNLTDGSNEFGTGNALLTYTHLGFLGNVAKDKLINYVHGFDAYDLDANGVTDTNRGALAEQWIMGDILHSKPAVVYYNSYTLDQEKYCDAANNSSLIYVGANDGMLHAFRDCDGEEEWAFIPPDLLPRLKYLKSSPYVHINFVDGSPIIYRYDANKDGKIDPATDKVLLMFGERRGGGGDSIAPDTSTGGSYYLLDITLPKEPKLVWSISNKVPTIPSTVTPVYPQLAETWSDPRIVKMKTNAGNKVVAVIGAGYDNLNEDSRYGATQTFTGTGTVDLGDSGSSGTSTGSALPLNPKGNGIYIIEIADLSDAGVPTVNSATSGKKIWEFITTLDPYSVPGEVATIDTDGDGFTDRLYFGNTGGSIWRCDVGDMGWTAKKLFKLSPGAVSTDKGRKVFYKPAVTLEGSGEARIYIGTGDREHPLNTSVVDRVYGLWDKNDNTTAFEANVMDVTANVLQLSTTTEAQRAQILNDLDTTYRGWYIKLEETGEKALAPARLYNEAAFFATFRPSTSAEAAASCEGNQGLARAYGVNYLTGEAIINYNAGNDFSTTDEVGYKSLFELNSRATPYGLTPEGGTSGSGVVLQKIDRIVDLPTGGIPSPPVIVNDTAFIGAGGALPKIEVKKGQSVFQLYWKIN